MPRLLRDLKSFYKTHARGHLPWRATHDPYKILVSEVMLQQTQVDRVIPFYERFIKKFPTPKKLAEASLADVLSHWQGLGYNRRGKYLWEAGKMLANEGWTGQKLPGVGPYTSAAVEAFAHNKPTVFIETNIRTIFLKYCFRGGAKNILVSDAQILPLVEKALKQSHMEPRDFYAALMDYGSFLKTQGLRINSRSKHYTKQSKFEGSYRQLRGAVLRAVLEKPKTIDELIDITNRAHGDVARVVANLAGEGIVEIKNKKISVAK
ncbi:MAG TPA: A/G-specific adenine glycosylase [Candidatus Paceibacterota bacterium]|nr:A/G-specific adenine glycosylase [Candidatus Paceibacterota bacterium]